MLRKNIRAFLSLPRRLLLPIIGLSVSLIGLSGYMFIYRPFVGGPGGVLGEQIAHIQNDPASKTPQFSTVTPNGEPIENFGGWTRVSPPDRNAVFAYSTKIDEVPVIISQQPLPEDFMNDTAVQTEQLAIGYKANHKIEINGTTVYIGTSAKGPQSVIYSTPSLLVLMKSSTQLSDAQWTKLIQSLK